MSKINPFSLPRPARDSKQYKIIDAQTNVEFTFTFRPLDALDEHRGAERGDYLIKEYILGRAGEEPREFPPIGNELIKPTETILHSAAIMETMQCSDNEADNYKAEEFVAICATCPNAWLQLLVLLSRLNNGETPND